MTLKSARLLRARRQAGFTLIEIAVVVALIGILATFAVLSIGNRPADDRLEAEAKRTKALIELAVDEAQLNGIQLGLRYTATGYQFMTLDAARGWTMYPDSGPLRARRWPAGITAELRVEGRVIPPAAEADSAPPGINAATKKADNPKPQLYILSSGEMTGFTLDLAAEGLATRFRLEGDELGRLSLNRQAS